MANGDFEPDAYKQLDTFRDWMNPNSESVKGTLPLAENESASVPATRSTNTTGNVARYLFALPKFKDNGVDDQVYEEHQLPAQDTEITFKGARQKPISATLLTDGKPLEFAIDQDVVTVKLPAARRSKLVDVVKLEFAQNFGN